ncbi:mersacidin/lichenicidin family type 2 lantibiotic [Archangium violaceum]|uniref:mersacidin/lichenicidin family type 2 lantibiotic n=1 Tax=Archangium violaceum TaxID=83451 RepID=UPI00193B59B3|nr:mersacidin/lichenicidin family type 2 lantibiotic [Archangium violaceum]QRK12138.1 mersacidin/lichenicidin family type 2 lantibiotic [Archangium violaceum]
MRVETIIRAWKDPAFRASLTSEERAALPELPSGRPVTELDEGELSDAVGGVSRPRGGCNPPEFTDIPCSAIDACPSALGCTFVAC